MRGAFRISVQHSLRKSLTRPKRSVRCSSGFNLGKSQPGAKAWRRSWKAVSFRISFGSGDSRCPTRCWRSTSRSKFPTMTIPPSARMLSLPRLNSPEAM